LNGVLMRKDRVYCRAVAVQRFRHLPFRLYNWGSICAAEPVYPARQGRRRVARENYATLSSRHAGFWNAASTPYGLSEAPVQQYGDRGNELLRATARCQRPFPHSGVCCKAGRFSSGIPWQAVPTPAWLMPWRKHGASCPAILSCWARARVRTAGRDWFLLDSRSIIRGTDLRDARVAAGFRGTAADHVHVASGCGHTV